MELTNGFADPKERLDLNYKRAKDTVLGEKQNTVNEQVNELHLGSNKSMWWLCMFCVCMCACVYVCVCVHIVCLVSVPRCSNLAALALDDRKIALLMGLADDPS